MERVLWPSGTLRVENNVIRPAPGELRAPAGLSRIYLLVHGFNNDRAKARESYQAFRERIAETIGPNSLRKIWEFYWPGYEEISVGSMGATEGRGWLSKFYTALNYHRQVPKAIEFGEILGRYLLSLGTPDNPTEIVFIGHSLGCRLILEAIDTMRPEAQNSRIPAIMLMAGAVPVSLVSGGGKLKPAARFARHRMVLYSSRDQVLRVAFPAGQVAAFDGLPRPVAIGLGGAPRECWTARDQTMLGHGEYWSNPGTTPNIVRLFGKTTSHALPASWIVPRELADSPELPVRSIRVNRWPR